MQGAAKQAAVSLTMRTTTPVTVRWMAMLKPKRNLFVIVLTIGCVISGPATFSMDDRTSITGRLQLAKKDGCLIAQIYLKNTQRKEIKIISGRGGVDDDQEVWFLCNGHKCSGSRWSSIAYRRSMEPVYKLLPPSTEVLFGTFVLPVPAARKGVPELTNAGESLIETRLDLYTDDGRQTCFQVELMNSVKLD